MQGSSTYKDYLASPRSPKILNYNLPSPNLARSPSSRRESRRKYVPPTVDPSMSTTMSSSLSTLSSPIEPFTPFAPFDRSDQILSNVPTSNVHRSQCRDLTSLIVFGVFQALYLGVLLFYISRYITTDISTKIHDGHWDLSMRDTFIYMGRISAVGGVFSLVLNLIICLFSHIVFHRFVSVALWGSFVYFGVSIVSMINNQQFNNTFTLLVLIACFNLILIVWKYKNIKFSNRLLVIASKGMVRYYGIFLIYFLAFLLIILSATCLFTISIIMSLMIRYDTDNKFIIGFVYVMYIGNTLYLSTIFANIINAVTTGVIGTYFYSSYTECDAWGALRRTLTKSLGSIIFASTVVGPLWLLQLVTCYAPTKKRKGFLTTVFRHANSHAFAFIALFGDEFNHASIKAFDVLVISGMSRVAKANITGIAVLLQAVITGLSMSMAVRYSIGFGKDHPSYEIYIHGLTFVLCFYIAYLVTMQLSNALDATIVVYSIDPEAMALHRGESYRAINTERRRRFPYEHIKEFFMNTTSENTLIDSNDLMLMTKNNQGNLNEAQIVIEL